MALTAEQIAEARSEGYTDAEILQHYAQAQGVDLKAARDEGYSDAEILSHISGSEVAPQEKEVVGTPQDAGTLTNPKLAASLGAGAGAIYSAKTLPIKAARALGTAVADRISKTPSAAPSPSMYTTPSGINVEQTPGGLHPGAVGNAQFNVEQQQANTLRQNMPSGFEQRGTSRIITPVGMQEPAAALGGARQPMGGLGSLGAAKQAVKAAVPSVGAPLQRAATSAPVAGALAGYNLQQAQNAKQSGDTTGKLLGYAGAGSQFIPLPAKYKIAKPLIGAGTALINTLRDEPKSVMVQNYKNGRAVIGEELMKQGIKAAKKIFEPKETQIVRASEALAPHEGKWLNVTQSDRMRSTGGDLGGPGFSRFQTIDPRYAEAQAAWGVGKKPTASALANVSKRFPEGQAIWSPMIGSETQHHSNQHVFDMLADEFNRQARMGKLTPELRERANQRLQTAPAYKGRFAPEFDIGNPEMLAEAGKTFDRRGALAEVMSGQGVGGQKGTIIDYPGIMQEMTDPMTIGAPTHSIGTRLFSLSGDVEHRPDLHSAFPYILKGEDYGVAFNPVPKELALQDWITQFKEFKGRTPGYYDMTRTVPSQQITDKYLRSLEEAGHAEGGAIHMAKGKLTGGLSTLPMAQRTDMRKMGQTIDEFHNADAYNKAKMLYNSPAVQGAMTAGSMVNPYVALGVGGGQMLRGMSEGDTEAMIGGGLNMLGIAPYVGKGIRAAKSFANTMMQNPRTPAMEERLYQTGASDYQPVPAMAGGGDVVKSLIKKALKADEGVGSRTIEGSPHTYPPIAEGPWMRDYQPATRPEPGFKFPVLEAGAPTDQPYLVKQGSTYTAANVPMPSEQRIQQMGLKNALATQSHPALREAQDRSILALMDQKRMNYIQNILKSDPSTSMEELLQMYPRYETWMR